MSDRTLIESISVVEQLGVGLPLLAWVGVVLAVGAMSFALRHERRVAVYAAGAGAAVLAFAGHLADYLVTLHRSPDPSLAANALWRATVDGFGIEAAKVYGLSGRILVSILAGQMFAFYLANARRLYPRRAGSFLEFALRLGNRARTASQRALAVLTWSAFLFAGMQARCFYVALVNAIDDPARADRMPSVPAVTVALLLALSASCLILTYATFRACPRTPTSHREIDPAYPPVARPASVLGVAARHAESLDHLTVSGVVVGAHTRRHGPELRSRSRP